jgi:hypothetical protein
MAAAANFAICPGQEETFPPTQLLAYHYMGVSQRPIVHRQSGYRTVDNRAHPV